MNNRIVKHILLFLILCLPVFSTTVLSQDTLKILAIGNSFSQDAAEAYVDDLSKAAGVKIIIGNISKGGCSLQTHWKYAEENTPDYSYRKITENDTILRTGSKTLLFAITNENWDYITFQQVSSLSGIFDSYFPYLTNLMEYVKKHATNPDVKFALHQTWAYATSSTHKGFSNYGRNQDSMYHAIVNTINQVSSHTGINTIIPAGTAIQNGRTSFIGDNFCRDGYHLDLNIGRYTAACTWFEKLTGKGVIGNTFIPRGVSASEAKVAQHAAHYAVQNPNSVTPMNNFTSND